VEKEDLGPRQGYIREVSGERLSEKNRREKESKKQEI